MESHGPSAYACRLLPRAISSVPPIDEVGAFISRTHSSYKFQGTFSRPPPYIATGKLEEVSDHAKRKISGGSFVPAARGDDRRGDRNRQRRNGGKASRRTLLARKGRRRKRRRERQRERAAFDGGEDSADDQSWRFAQRARDDFEY